MITSPIPLPGSAMEGFDTGLSGIQDMFSKIVKQQQAREEMDRLRQLLPLEKQAKLAQIAHSNAAANRAAQLFPLKLQAAKNALDPNYEFNALVKMLGGSQGTGTPKEGMEEEGLGTGNVPGAGTPQPNFGTGEGMMRLPEEHGLLARGNIDLNTRPVVKNPNGGYSTVASMGIGLDNGKEVLIPTVSEDGKMMTPAEAIAQFKKTGKHLGVFDSTEAANNYAQKLHEQQANQYGGEISKREMGTQNVLTRLMNDNTPEGIARRMIIAKKYPGLLKASNEPPEMKRAAELKDKMALAKYNHELKQAESQEKAEQKTEAGRQKIVAAAQSDLPHLEETLRGLKEMKKIADDPKNDDMFGHWWLGNDAAAARSDNPNVGIWQINGLGPIVDAEMKMSSKGNQVALKNAIAMKPNFAEKRASAQSKLNAQIGQVERRIAETKRLAGMESNDVVVVDPNGKKFKTTRSNAEHLPAGWKRG